MSGRPSIRAVRGRRDRVVALAGVVVASGALVGAAVVAPPAGAAARTVVRVDGPVVRGTAGVLRSVATCPAGTVPIGVTGLATFNGQLTRLGIGTPFGVGRRSVVALARPAGTAGGEYGTRASALCATRPSGYQVVKVRRVMTAAQRQAALAQGTPVLLKATAACPVGKHLVATAFSTTRSGLSDLRPGGRGTVARAVVDPASTTTAAVTAAAVCASASFAGPDLVLAPSATVVQDATAGGFARSRVTCPAGQALSGGVTHRLRTTNRLRLNTFEASGATFTVTADGLPVTDTVRAWALCLA